MKSITRTGDHIVVRFERGEAALLAALPAFLSTALRAVRPARMAGDEATDAELHQLLDAELAARRVERQDRFLQRLGEVPGAGGPLALTLEEGEQWLAYLTDLRLALAAQLGIKDDAWGRDLDPRQPPTQEHGLYFYLSALQEGLLAKGFDVA